MEELLNCHLRKIDFEDLNVIEVIGTEVKTERPTQDQEKDAPNKEVKKWSPSDEDTDKVEPGQVKDALIIPTKEEVKKWSPLQVVGFLEKKKDELFLQDKYIKVIEDQEVSGQAFLRLTEEKLLSPPFSLPLGPAKAIARLIETLKGEEQGN